jgi:hypothetical protein
MDAFPPEPENGYNIGTRAFGNFQRVMLVAEIRLYANAHTPIYHVVVGDAVGTEKVAVALEKMKPFHVSALNTIGLSGKLKHWEPTVNPLPFWSKSAQIPM